MIHIKANILAYPSCFLLNFMPPLVSQVCQCPKIHSNFWTRLSLLDLFEMPAPLDVNSPAYKKALRLYKKSQKTPAADNLPQLREQEKAFKARFPPPSLSEALDLSWNEYTHGNAWKGVSTVDGLEEIQTLDGKGAYTIKSAPGKNYLYLYGLVY